MRATHIQQETAVGVDDVNEICGGLADSVIGALRVEEGAGRVQT